MGPGGFFPTNPDLADILGDMDFDFDIFFFGPHKKNVWDGPKWGREGLFPANPDLADILGDMDLDFENFHF